ncbi:MAG TPA: hypothetical protein VHD33_03685 [Legionellaceae bacterium]|nr:hypothetical protein [Legionellaceae bacterium]
MDRIKAGKKYMGRWKALSASEWVEAKRRSECEWVDIHGDQITDATKPMNAIYRKQIIGNRLFWICLGIDQLIHHLTHYVCIYFILKALGKF